jgi:MraZ protein
VEIWAKAQWDQYNARAAAAYEEIAENIVDLDLGI